jgi:septal ring factor EnvC (AmiA/AmiB activator)
MLQQCDSDVPALGEQSSNFSINEAFNAMLLNEFVKEHRRNQEQEATIRQFKSAIIQQASTNAAQQREIETLTAALKEQAAQIQQVSAQLAAANPSRGGLELTKVTARVVNNEFLPK